MCCYNMDYNTMKFSNTKTYIYEEELGSTFDINNKYN